jgi:hypothetical protein
MSTCEFGQTAQKSWTEQIHAISRNSKQHTDVLAVGKYMYLLGLKIGQVADSREQI